MFKGKLFQILAVLAVFAIVNSYPTQDFNNVFKNINKKGIVLKCQGNPVSCYGKRSSGPEFALGENSIENDMDSRSQEQSFEKVVMLLVGRCHKGLTKSCEAIMDMLLMNA